jgi:hypothetical protein
VGALLAEFGASIVESQVKIFEVTRQMQEMQMSFNLQYLQLQSQMQNENRSCTAISNIMKTMVKNSISKHPLIDSIMLPGRDRARTPWRSLARQIRPHRLAVPAGVTGDRRDRPTRLCRHVP